MTRTVILAVSALLVCADAFAQAPDPRDPRTTRPARPYRGLFGDDEGRPDGRQTLNLRLAAFESYDENVLGERASSPNLLDPRTQNDGLYSGFAGVVDYHNPGRRFSVDADAGTSIRYFPTLNDLVGLEHQANVAVTGRFQRTSLFLSQGIEFMPFYSFRFLPEIAADSEDVPTTLSDGTLGVDRRDAYLFTSTAAVSHSLGPRSSLSGNYSVRLSRFRNEATSDLTSIDVGGHYRHQMTRYAALRLGYSLQEGRYRRETGRTNTRVHSFDVGAEYSRPLSFSRRTFVNFDVGASSFEGLDGRQVFRVLGDAGLSHEMGRTWALEATYHRGAGLIEGLSEPVFSDSVNTWLAGYITRRLDLLIEGEYAEGEVGSSGLQNPFDSVLGTARLRFAITRRIALFGEYFYYGYQFARDYALPAGMPRQLDRHGARAGVMVFVPIVQ